MICILPVKTKSLWPVTILTLCELFYKTLAFTFSGESSNQVYLSEAVVTNTVEEYQKLFSNIS